MMKEEFEQLIGREVNDDDYKVIEYVYAHHPLVPQKADALLDKYRAMTDALKIGAKPGK